MRSFSVYAKLIDTGCSDCSEECHQAAFADRVGGQTPAVPAGQTLNKQTVSSCLQSLGYNYPPVLPARSQLIVKINGND